jgi:hypothetical protein
MPPSQVNESTSQRLIGVISDTHGRLPARALELFLGAEAILHAGDVGSTDILTELEVVAPVHAVHGNVDPYELTVTLPPRRVIDLGGVRVGIAHGHMYGGPSDRHDRLRAAFVPDKVDLIIYGHTHRACVDDKARPWVVNPGTAGQNRGHGLSIALLRISTDGSFTCDIVEIA